jgi:hypothetical protein
MLSVSLDFLFLLAPSVFSNVYCHPGTSKNRKSRETGNIGYTRYRMKTNVREYRRGKEK